MSWRNDPYGGWTVVGHNQLVYVGETSDDKKRAFFLAPPGPPDNPPPGSAPEGLTGTVFEAELNEEDERIVPIPDREWVAETEDELRDIIEEIHDDIDSNALSEFMEQHLSSSNSSSS